MAVSFAELKKYIKSILKDADLTKLSSKMIRRRCEEEFEADLTSQKQEIDKIIMTCIDENSDNKRTEATDDSGTPESSESSSEDEVIIPDAVPEKKLKQPSREKTSSKVVVTKKNVTPKQKKPAATYTASSDSDNDAAVARKLQEEEWNFRRRNVKRTVTKKSAAKSKKNRGSDDKPKVRKGNSSYTRKCLLSEELAAVMDTNEMARHDVVKKMWSIVRERNLLDPANKQFALCDDQLQKVFGTRRIRMFGMMKYLKNHVKDLK